MLLETLLGYKSVWRILALYSPAPGVAYTREELRQKTKLGNQSLSSAIERLVKYKLLFIKRIHNKNYYKLNLTRDYIDLILQLCKKETFELMNLDYDILLPLRDFVRKSLEKTSVIQEVVLFGNIAKRISVKGPKIDLAIIMSEESNKDQDMIKKISQEIERRFGIKLKLYFALKKDFEKKTQFNIEIKKNGIYLVP